MIARCPIIAGYAVNSQPIRIRTRLWSGSKVIQCHNNAVKRFYDGRLPFCGGIKGKCGGRGLSASGGCADRHKAKQKGFHHGKLAKRVSYKISSKRTGGGHLPRRLQPFAGGRLKFPRRFIAAFYDVKIGWGRRRRVHFPLGARGKSAPGCLEISWPIRA